MFEQIANTAIAFTFEGFSVDEIIEILREKYPTATVEEIASALYLADKEYEEYDNSFIETKDVF